MVTIRYRTWFPKRGRMKIEEQKAPAFPQLHRRLIAERLQLQ
jgi:hypothetical protein